jgi:hypothetical protein
MGKFKKFLMEEESTDNGVDTEVDLETLSADELLQLIKDQLADMDEDEIYAFAYVLYYEFFEDDTNQEDDYTDFDIEDVNDMIGALGAEMYIDILDLLLPSDEDDNEMEDDEDTDSYEDGDGLGEGVSRRMKGRNMNRKRRKFMKISKSMLRRTKVKRKQMARKNRAKAKRYYRANKVKIASYQKSRSTAIKKGKHKVKLRRPA